MSKLRVHRRGSVSTPQDSATNLLPRFGGDDPLKEPESVTRYRQFLAGPHLCGNHIEGSVQLQLFF
jgi:hypothetical protein